MSAGGRNRYARDVYRKKLNRELAESIKAAFNELGDKLSQADWREREGGRVIEKSALLEYDGGITFAASLEVEREVFDLRLTPPSAAKES